MTESEEHNEHNKDGLGRSKAPRRSILPYLFFLLIVITLAFAGGYLIRLYFKSNDSNISVTSSSKSNPLKNLEEQWREHRLPLDIKSLAALWEDMRRDIETQKAPQLKEKLEGLREQIEEKRDNAKPELEEEWKKLSEKVDGLLATLQDKRDDWMERFSEVQDETRQLLQKEIEDAQSPTPTPEGEI